MGDSAKYGNAVDFDVDLHSVYAAYLYVPCPFARLGFGRGASDAAGSLRGTMVWRGCLAAHWLNRDGTAMSLPAALRW